MKVAPFETFFRVDKFVLHDFCTERLSHAHMFLRFNLTNKNDLRTSLSIDCRTPQIFCDFITPLPGRFLNKMPWLKTVGFEFWRCVWRCAQRSLVWHLSDSHQIWPLEIKKNKGGILKQTLVIGSQGQGFCKINKKKKYNDGCKNSKLFMITEYSSKIHNLSWRILVFET